MKRIDTQERHITPSGGNVFIDLGFSRPEAEALKAASQRIIDEKLRLRNLRSEIIQTPVPQK